MNVFPLSPEFFNDNPDLYNFFLDTNPSFESAAKLAPGYLHHVCINGSPGCETLSPLTLAIITMHFAHFKAILRVFVTQYHDLLKKEPELNLDLSFIIQQAKMAWSQAIEMKYKHAEPVF